MKLRFESNKIKFRLSANEINLLVKSKNLKEEINLPGEKLFSYEIVKSEDKDKLSLQINDNSIAAIIPSKSLDNWINSGEVGVSNELDMENQVKFTIVIEKDLPRRKQK